MKTIEKIEKKLKIIKENKAIPTHILLKMIRENKKQLK